MPVDESDFPVDARVQLSLLGQSRSPKMTRSGIILGRVGTSYTVLMDGSKRPVQLHKSYLMLDPSAPDEPR